MGAWLWTTDSLLHLRGGDLFLRTRIYLLRSLLIGSGSVVSAFFLWPASPFNA